MKRAKRRLSPVARTGRTAGLFAAGSVCVLLAKPAAAVELGDIEIDSVLGQPLRASIAFALGPNERLADNCVYLRAAPPAGGLPAVTRASATVSGQRLVLRGNTALREPMMSLQVVIDCPYTPHLRRDYLLLLNPPGRAAATDRVEARPAARVAPATSRAAAAPRAERPRPTAATTPIAAGQDYRVRPGDTLSGIASRISDRSAGLWPAIEQIFAANPTAFPDGDIDRLMAGVTLRIPPGVAASAPPTVATVPAGARGVAYQGVGSASRPAGSDAQPPRIEDAAATPAGAALPPVAADAPGATNATSNDAAAGESADGGAAAPAPAAPPVDLREAAATPPALAAAAPRAAEPIPLAGAADSPAQSWLVWLGGGGIAIFLALLIFGRRLRARFDEDTAVAPGRDPGATADGTAPRRRRSTDRRGAGQEEAGPDDATDFDTGEDLDVALDFSFASSGELSGDLDFIVEESQITTFPPEDIGAAQDDDLAPTQEMPSRETGAATGDVAGVTDRFPPPGERPKDLETIEVEALDSRPRQGLDLTSEFDYEVLEQDYEEELTATHALSVDIEQAARELQRELGENDDDDRVSTAGEADGSAEVTAAMPADMLPPRGDNDDQDSGDDTDINEMPTSRLPQSDETVEMDSDATVEHRSKTG